MTGSATLPVRANLAGIGLMIGAMLGFAVEDAIIKMLSVNVATGQILIVIGLGTAIIFGLATLRRGHRLLDRRLLHPAVIIRCLGELVGTAGFVSALALSPISTASAIIQANPLIVTLGAALVLKERVGPRRWAAVFIGLFGVYIILRPGSEGIEVGSLLAIVGVLGLSIRDVATRRIPPDVSTMALASLGSATVVPAGLVLFAFGGQPSVPSTGDMALLGLGVIVGIAAYYAITAAMRVGEVSAVTPFRYTRLIFALPIGYLVFGERPDAAMYIGAFIIVSSGLYVLWREARAG